MSIRSKFVTILVFCLVSVAAGIFFATRHYAVREAEASFAREAESQFDRVDDIIHLYFASAEQAARNLAALPGIRDIALARNATEEAAKPSDLEAALTQVLGALPSLVPGVEAAFCGYKNGSFHSSSPSASPGRAHGDYDARTQSWYSDTAWGASDVSITDIAISKASKSLAAVIAARIKDNDGETLGVAALTMNLGPLMDALRDVRLGASGRLALFDPRGRVLFDPAAQENLLLPAADAGEILASAMELPSGQHTLVAADTEYAVFSRVFPDSRWKAALIMENAERTAPGGRLTLVILAAAVTAALGLGLLGAALSFGATRPLYALIRQSKALADGNAEAMGGIAGRGPDIAALQGHIGQLTGRVMLLAQAEKEHASEIEAYARKAVAANQTRTEQDARAAYRRACRALSGALAPFASETASNAASIAALAAKMHDHARTQVLAVNNVRTATLSLLDDAATTARQAAETEKTAEMTLEFARKADKLAREAGRAIESLEDVAQSLFPGLETLKADAERMAGLTASVRDLAEKINVLGLKLSIEVSSAGDAGKKFVPVTEEMRALAEQAMTAAGAMDGIIASSLQTHAAQSLATGKNTTAAKRAAAGSQKAGNALVQAVAAVSTTVEQIRVLSITLEGLAQGNGLDTDNADAVLRTARESSEALRALDETAAALSSLSGGLASLADGLESPPGDGEARVPGPRAALPGQKQLD